jgi:hypothetical protein
MPTTVTVDTLFGAESPESVLSTLLGIASRVKLKVTAWQPGQPLRTALVLCSQKMADTSLLMRLAIKGGYLDESEAGWLTLLAHAVYRVDRNVAQFATTSTGRVINSGTSVFARAAGELAFVHSVSGKTYTNVNDISVNPGATQDGIVILSDETGSASDAGPGMIELSTTIPNVTFTNVEACLGADEETDEDLRQRCRDKLGSLSPNGPKEAYAYVAKTPALNPTSVPITRVQVVLNKATGALTVYLATATGAPSADDVTLTDKAIDRWATPWLVDSAAAAAAEVVTPITYHVWVSGSNDTTEAIESRIAATLARFYRLIPINGWIVDPDPAGYVYWDQIKAAILKDVPEIIRIDMSSTSGGVSGFTLTAGQVMKLGAITPTVTVVP